MVQTLTPETAITMLQAQQSESETTCDATLAECQSMHPGLPGPWENQVNDGRIAPCECCEEPGFAVLNVHTLTWINLCRHAINILRLTSLRHIGRLWESGENICFNCVIRYDSLGLVIGAYHHHAHIRDIPAMVARKQIVLSGDGLRVIVKSDGDPDLLAAQEAADVDP